MAFATYRSTLNPKHLNAEIDISEKVIKAETYKTQLAAKDIITLANKQAEDIIEQAKHILASEKERGYREGKEMAQLDQAEKMIENVSKTIDYFGQIEDEVVKLVLTSVKKIISDYNDEPHILLVVRNALSAVRNQKQLVLRVAPSETEMVKKSINELLVDFPAIGFIDVVSDARLSNKACIVETEIGLVETSLEGQLKILENTFKNTLGGGIS